MASLVKLVPINRLRYLTKIQDITIDDITFRLHYRFTFSFLLIGSLLLTGEQFFGKPIQCLKSHGVPQKVIESYCWIEGTFTLPKSLMKVIGFEVAAPGIEQYTEFVKEVQKEKDEIISHAYYQWVGVVLFLQSLTFYVTHLIWKKWEKGRISKIINGLNKIIVAAEKKQTGQDELVTYLLKKRGRNNVYSFRYFICEVLNLINIILQMIFVNYFLGGEFASYGLDVLKFLDDEPALRDDPMSRVFPKMTKCTFRKFGPSGDVQKFDHLCMLPLNILNEKLFIIFWFWFYIVLFFSAFSVLYRVVVIAFPFSRYFLLGKLHRKADPEDINIILDHFSYGDWFLIYLLGSNLDPMHYRDVLGELADRLSKPHSNHIEEEEDLEKIGHEKNDTTTV